MPYVDYKLEIYNGFSSFLKKIEKNKEKIILHIEKNLANKKVRQILRPTQKYTDLLRYSYHSTCMENAIEREKVLHNLWAYSFENKLISMYEFDEMMDGDIPQFFINTSEKNIYTNDGVAINDMFKDSPINIVKNKINSLDKKSIEQQMNIIKCSFQDFKYQDYVNIEKENQIPRERTSILAFINELSESILKYAIVSEKDKSLTFLDINDDFEQEVLSLSEGLYDGLSGIYLFLIASDYINENSENLVHREYIYNLIIKMGDTSKISAFFGKSSLIYPLMVEYKLLNNIEALHTAEKIAKDIMEKDIIEGSDWLYSSINMVPVFHSLFKITRKKEYLKFAKKIAGILKNEELKYNGFAHGKSSYYYINSFLSVFDESTINEIIAEENSYVNEHGWKSEKNNDTYFSGWCKGDLGIKIARIASDTNVSTELIKMCKENMALKNNNTLCHGNATILELLIQMKNKNIIDSFFYEKEVQKILNNILGVYKEAGKYNVYSGLNGESLGLFTGVAGVGYQLIRLLDNKVPNVLFLEL